MRRHERLILSSLAIAALVASGCADPNEAGVDIKNLSADIVFGVEEEGKSAPPPPVAPQEPEQVDDDSFPEFDDEPATTPTTRRQVSLRPVSSCPPAAQNEFPAEEAGIEVTKMPKEGAYRWKRGGTSRFTAIPGQTFPVSGFETRLVRRVATVAKNPQSGATSLEFTFQTVQPLRGGGAIVSTWIVRTAAQQAATAGAAGTPVRRTGDPERGLALRGVEVVDSKGAAVSTWSAGTGLLLFPLRVLPGEEFSSVAVEPRSGRSLAFNGKVIKREQLDACGDVIDSWRVEGTLSGNVEGVPTGAYQLNVATQFGALPVFEKYSTADSQGSSDLTFTYGQLNPDPLPPEAK